LAGGASFAARKKNEKHLLKKLKQIKTTVLNVPLKTCQERFYF
jgi:PDZ domain-containing secreted protein